MDNPRPEKVAVVDEVRERFSRSDAAVLTEYRGLNVADISALRRTLRTAGGDYKIYKNTLVRFAARDLGLEIEDLLTGPTAIAFVDGDPVAVAKALRDFARTHEQLVVKGGVLGDKLLSAEDTRALADVAPREELLARLAGAMAAPMVQFAGLLEALPRNFAYGLAALIEQQGGVPETPSAPEAPAEAEADTTQADAAPDTEAAAPEAPAPVAEASDETAATAASDDAAPAADEPAADPAPESDSETETETETPVAEAAETPTEDN